MGTRRLLRSLYPQRHREALIRDLVERFRDGHSVSWFWRQVIVAILIGSSRQVTRWADISLACSWHGIDLVCAVGRAIPDCGGGIVETRAKWGLVAEA